MGRARGVLVFVLVSSAAACTLADPLSGLTGGGGEGDAASDVTTETTANDANPNETGSQSGGDSGESGNGANTSDGGGDAQPADASDGGPARDGGKPDAATGPVPCADAGVLLCEDFENGLDGNKWSTTTTDATAVVDGTQHHRGSYALHLNSPALATDGSAVNVAASIRHYVALPSPVFIRAFVMFSSAQPQSTESFFVAQQSGAPYDGLQLEVDQGTGDYAVTDWTVSPTFYALGAVGPAAATWTCVEWELDPPASGMATTNTDVWVDGTEVSSLHLTNTPMTDLEQLGFGLGFYQVTSLPAYDMWIDDIYVDTAPVGCTK